MPPSNHGHRALEEYKATLGPEPANGEANWHAITRRLAAGEAPLELEELPTPREPTNEAAPRGSVVAWMGAGVAVAAAAVAVFTVGSQTIQRREGDAMPEAARAHAEAPGSGRAALRARDRMDPRETSVTPSTPATAPDPTPEPESTPTVDPGPNTEPKALGGSEPEPEDHRRSQPDPRPREPAHASARVKPAPQPAPKAEPAQDQPNRVAAEAALLGRARAALRDGNPAAALDVLARYGRRFPQGLLREEAEVVEIAALCDAGQVERARTAASRFLQQHASSPLSGHARRICTEGHG